MNIIYFAEYDGGYNDRNLSSSPAGLAKMRYIISAIKGCGYSVVVWSMSRTKNRYKFYPSKTIKIDEKESVHYRSTFSAKGKIIFHIERAYARLQLFLKLLFLNSDDVVMVYHEIYYLPVLKIIKKIRNIKLVYEMEELYYTVARRSRREKMYEIDTLKIADGYILANVLLNEKVNPHGKSAIVCNGTYTVVPQVAKKDEYTQINIVYSGTFDSGKGYALAAIEAARYLDGRYCLHIAGHGNKKDTDAVKKRISEISTETECNIIFEGYVDDDSYFDFLQRCDIGISVQEPHSKINDVLFPSKILMYLSNGLEVVSPTIRALELSPIGERIFFYNSEDPRSMADAIERAHTQKHDDNREFIHQLDLDFICKLKCLIDKVEKIY